MDHPFLSARFRELAGRFRQAYAEAQPFPHIVIDDFLDPKLLKQVAAEFPQPDGAVWHKHYHANSKKLALNDVSQMGDATRHLLWAFNSGEFVAFLEQLTGIEGLIPDPHYQGGGLHQIERGGFLRIHADFNWDKRLQLDRRLNVLIYLNENWQDQYGGGLELWDADMKTKSATILPLFNRCVVFSTTDFSLHGHPDPLECPSGTSRKSLAFYYYTNGRPAGEVSSPHLTLYRRRPGEGTSGSRWRTLLQKFMPPVVYEVERAIRGRDWRKMIGLAPRV